MESRFQEVSCPWATSGLPCRWHISVVPTRGLGWLLKGKSRENSREKERSLPWLVYPQPLPQITDRKDCLRQDPPAASAGVFAAISGKAQGKSGRRHWEVAEIRLLMAVRLPRTSVLLSSPHSPASVSFSVWAGVKKLFQKVSKEA